MFYSHWKEFLCSWNKSVENFPYYLVAFENQTVNKCMVCKAKKTERMNKTATELCRRSNYISITTPVFFFSSSSFLCGHQTITTAISSSNKKNDRKRQSQSIKIRKESAQQYQRPRFIVGSQTLFWGVCAILLSAFFSLIFFVSQNSFNFHANHCQTTKCECFLMN